MSSYMLRVRLPGLAVCAYDCVQDTGEIIVRGNVKNQL